MVIHYELQNFVMVMMFANLANVFLQTFEKQTSATFEQGSESPEFCGSWLFLISGKKSVALNSAVGFSEIRSQVPLTVPNFDGP